MLNHLLVQRIIDKFWYYRHPKALYMAHDMDLLLQNTIRWCIMHDNAHCFVLYKWEGNANDRR